MKQPYNIYTIEIERRGRIVAESRYTRKDDATKAVNLLIERRKDLRNVILRLRSERLKTRKQTLLREYLF